MVDASWLCSEIVKYGGGAAGRGVPHVLGPSCAYDEAWAEIPSELVGGRKLRVEYTRMFGYGGSSYEIKETVAKDLFPETKTLEKYDSLAAAKKSAYADVFRKLYTVYKSDKAKDLV